MCQRGQRALSKVFFCKKVCFGVPEELLCVKFIYILHAPKHELQYYIPTQALSEKFYFLIYQKLILYFQTFFVKCPNYGRGRGGSEPSLSVQTFCVHTCLMGGGVRGGLDNVQSLVVFFFDGSPNLINPTNSLNLTNSINSSILNNSSVSTFSTN